MNRWLALGLAAIAVVWLWGAAGTLGPKPAPAGPIEITLSEMSFTPSRIDAKVGQTLTLVVTNRGVQRHDLAFESIHMPGLAGAETILEPGETRTLTVTFDAAGVHPFTCSVAGHAEAGMTGAVFVTQ